MTASRFIDESGFPAKSRIWKRSDFFTALIQIDFALCAKSIPSPSDVLQRVEAFYQNVDREGIESSDIAVSIYAKASIQASNDRLNRTRRGVIFEAVMQNASLVDALKAQRFH